MSQRPGVQWTWGVGGGEGSASPPGVTGLSALPMESWSCHVFPFNKLTAVMIRRGFAANLRIYTPAGRENEFQLLVQLAEDSRAFGM